ncbi:MAG: gfo/Idh/MocA family oxidoreductase, partial [Pseudomonadota bacterium]
AESLRICKGADLTEGRWQDVAAGPVPTVYERFADAILDKTKPEPDFAHGARLQAALDTAEVSNAQNGQFLKIAL